MSESFAEMLEESIKQIHTGEIVDGTVIDVKEDQIILNIGYKADGIITRNEYSSDPNVDLRDVVKVGDEMQAKVRKVNDGEGQVILSRKGLVAEQGSKKLEEAFENRYKSRRIPWFLPLRCHSAFETPARPCPCPLLFS